MMVQGISPVLIWAINVAYRQLYEQKQKTASVQRSLS